MDRHRQLPPMEELQKEVGSHEIKLTDFIGRGAFGGVFKGETANGVKCAVKFAARPANPFYDRYVVDEGRKQMMLQSPNIVRVFDTWTTPKYTITVMELCDCTLAEYVVQRINEERPLEEGEVRELFRQIANGVATLHQKGHAHRDLKPANILLKLHRDGTFTAKLADFGFAKKSGQLRTNLGTPGFTAPEIGRQQKYTPKCDIWSLGVTMAWVFLRPLRTNPLECSKNAMIRSSTSACCRDLMAKMMVDEPEKRYSAAQMLSHPYLIPTIQLLTLDSTAAAQPVEFELGDFVFDRHQQRLRVREPAWDSLRPTWGEIASKKAGIKEVDTLIVLTKGGTVLKAKDVVSCTVTKDGATKCRALLIRRETPAAVPAAAPAAPAATNAEDELDEKLDENASNEQLMDQVRTRTERINQQCNDIIQQTHAAFDRHRVICAFRQDIFGVKAPELFQQHTQQLRKMEEVKNRLYAQARALILEARRTLTPRQTNGETREVQLGPQLVQRAIENYRAFVGVAAEHRQVLQTACSEAEAAYRDLQRDYKEGQSDEAGQLRAQLKAKDKECQELEAKLSSVIEVDKRMLGEMMSVLKKLMDENRQLREALIAHDIPDPTSKPTDKQALE